jgi:hypothetical protein
MIMTRNFGVQQESAKWNRVISKSVLIHTIRVIRVRKSVQEKEHG